MADRSWATFSPERIDQGDLGVAKSRCQGPDVEFPILPCEAVLIPEANRFEGSFFPDRTARVPWHVMGKESVQIVLAIESVPDSRIVAWR